MMSSCQTSTELPRRLCSRADVHRVRYKLIRRTSSLTTPFGIASAATYSRGPQREAIDRVFKDGGAVYPSKQQAEGRGLHRGELRSNRGMAARERTVRPRERRIHRRGCADAQMENRNGQGGTLVLDEVGDLS